jgi:uncharacterized membrane protein HdeD (DUF308 family)
LLSPTQQEVERDSNSFLYNTISKPHHTIELFIIKIFKQKVCSSEIFYFTLHHKALFYMNKDKALESVNEIKELMEKSSKFISLSGLAAIMAGIYALVGAYIATQVITPDTHLIVALELMAIIASLVLVAAAVTACILSYYKSKKTGQKFFSRLTYRALWNFSLPMLTGGVLCISILMHEYYDILASVMLLFYGLALVNVSKFTYSSIIWLGYAFICLGVVDCFWEGHSLLFWTIGFGGFHILYGILFYLHYERKRS